MLKTKFVCTLGPACDDPDVLRRLINGGMDVARMNFSHGTHEQHQERLDRFRSICAEEKQAIPVMLDTKGPEIRTGDFPGGKVTLVTGQNYVLTTADVPCDDRIASVSYAGLPDDAKVGGTLLIDDGLLALEVMSVSGTEVHCKVLNDGEIAGHKSVNLPGQEVRLPALGEQDKDDIVFGVKNHIDYIAASFIRKSDDVREIKTFLALNGGEDIPVIAKIESAEGLRNLEEIIHVTDGIMVARGDLGVEIPLEQVPAAQKSMINLCREWGKPVITATQMLDSMIRSPRPTRAEVTDVANAVYDGTSAVMLSGETAAGKYPLEALATMRRIVEESERDVNNAFRYHDLPLKTDNVTDSIAHATCAIASDLNAGAIVTVTARGFSARQIASRQPDCPILAITFNERTYHRLRLLRGVYPVFCKEAQTSDELFDLSVAAAKTSGFLGEGDVVVITAGLPLGVSGTTNMLRVEYL